MRNVPQNRFIYCKIRFSLILSENKKKSVNHINTMFLCVPTFLIDCIKYMNKIMFFQSHMELLNTIFSCKILYYSCK